MLPWKLRGSALTGEAMRTTYILRLSTESGGTLSTDCVTAENEITLAELVQRCEFGKTPANDGDIITVEEDDE